MPDASLTPALAFIALWAGWAISWVIAAVWSTRTVRRQAPAGRIAYGLVVLMGAVLLWHRTSDFMTSASERWNLPFLRADRLWHVGYDGAWILVGATAFGFLFTWWARIHLGKLWSGTITLKEGHHVVDTGPYRMVRHPIYTGLLIATWATAAAIATWPALLGAAVITLGLWMKARMEEKFLATELGDAYAQYKKRAGMLVPFI